MHVCKYVHMQAHESVNTYHVNTPPRMRVLHDRQNNAQDAGRSGKLAGMGAFSPAQRKEVPRPSGRPHNVDTQFIKDLQTNSRGQIGPDISPWVSSPSGLMVISRNSALRAGQLLISGWPGR